VAARKPLLRLPRRLLLLLKLLRLLRPLLLLTLLLRLTLPLRLLTLLLRPKHRSNLGNEVVSAKPAQAEFRSAGLFYWHS
jgi:hypothetical protein